MADHRIAAEAEAAAAKTAQPFVLGATDGLWRASGAERVETEGDARRLPEAVHPHA